MLLTFDFVKFKLSVDNNLVKISAPMYGTTFEINDIEEVNMVDSFSKLFRTNGAGTDRYSLGNYSVERYGKSKLYVYNENPPYIAIKLKGEYIFID
ncbi:MAG: PH domain-containing protein [Bacilli bacterium]